MKIFDLEFSERKIANLERHKLVNESLVCKNHGLLDNALIFDLVPFSEVTVAVIPEQGSFPTSYTSIYMTPSNVGLFAFSNSLLDHLSLEHLKDLDNASAPYMAALRIRAAGSLGWNVIEDADRQDIREAFGFESAPLTINENDKGWSFTAYRKSSDGTVIKLSGTLSTDGRLHEGDLTPSPRKSLPMIRYR